MKKKNRSTHMPRVTYASRPAIFFFFFMGQHRHDMFFEKIVDNTSLASPRFW
jgi:hypothetical protein